MFTTHNHLSEIEKESEKKISFNIFSLKNKGRLLGVSILAITLVILTMGIFIKGSDAILWLTNVTTTTIVSSIYTSSSLDNNSEKFNVTLDIINSRPTHKTLYIKIQNIGDSSDHLDMETILNRTDFDISEMKNVKFSEILRNQSYQEEVANWTMGNRLINVSINYTKIECDLNISCSWNSTNSSCLCKAEEAHSYINNYYFVPRIRDEYVNIDLEKVWEGDKEKKKNKTKKHKWKKIDNIKSGEIKEFLLEFDHPFNWGSKGVIWLDLNGKTYVDFSGSSWWNEAWLKARQINITNTDSKAHDFEIVKLNVSYITNKNSTRILYNDSGTWKNVDFEFNSSNKNELFFIANYSSIGAGTEELDYWVYYDVSGQINEGNSTIFSGWRDDCEDGVLTEWTTSGTFTADAISPQEGGYYCKLVSGSGYQNTYRSGGSLSEGFVVWYMRTSSLFNACNHNIQIGETSGDSGFEVYWGGGSNGNLFCFDPVSAACSNYNTGSSANTWYALKMELNTTDAFVYINNSFDTAITPSSSPVTSIDIFYMSAYVGGYEQHADYIFVGENNMSIYLTPSTINVGEEETEEVAGNNPNILTLEWNTTTYYTTDNLQANITVNTTDDTTATCQWETFKDTVLQSHGNVTVSNLTETIIATIVSADTTRDEIWNVTVTCNNTVGFSSVESIKKTISNSIPVLTSVAATPDPIKGGDTITFTPTGQGDSDLETLYYYCDETSTPTSVNTDCSEGNTGYSSAYGSMTCTFTSETDDTTHTRYCRTYDGTAYSTARSDTYTTDSTPPSLAINLPKDGYNYSSLTQELNITTTGADSCWHSINNWTDNISWTNTTSRGYTFPNEGSFYLRIGCNDTLGNVNDSEYVLITIDTTAPTISDESLNATLIDINASITLNATVVDATLDVDSVFFFLETPEGDLNLSATAGANNEYYVICNDSGGSTGTCFTNVSRNYNYISVWVNDTVGNVDSSVVTLQFNVSYVPEITELTVYNDSLEEPAYFVLNQTARVRINITHPEGASHLDEWYISISNPLGEVEVNNETVLKFQDLFDRSNGNPYPKWENITAGWEIYGNKIRPTTSTTYYKIVLVNESEIANQTDLTIQVRALIDFSNEDSERLIFRYTDKDNYAAAFMSETYSAIGIEEYVGGTRYFVDTSQLLSEDKWYTLKVHVQGSTATVYLDGVEKTSKTLVTSGSGRVGLGADTGWIYYDNYTVGSPSASKVADIPNGYQYEYNYTVPDNSSKEGTWVVNVWALDTDGDLVNASTTFTVTAVVPVITDLRTINISDDLTSIFKLEQKVTTRANITDPQGRGDLSVANIIITNPKGTIKANTSMSNISQIANGFVYEYNYTIPISADSEGTWTIQIIANDSVNNWRSKSTTFTVSEEYPVIEKLTSNNISLIFETPYELNQNLTIRANISDTQGRADLSYANITIFYPDKTIAVDNVAMTDIGDITNGDYYEYNYTPDESGTYKVYVNCSDLSSHNTSRTIYFLVNWWNSTWERYQPINLVEIFKQNHTQEQMGFNFSSIHISSCDELRIIDQYGVEVPYDVWWSDTTGANKSCIIQYEVNISESEDTDYFIYYNYSAASAPSYTPNFQRTMKLMNYTRWGNYGGTNLTYAKSVLIWNISGDKTKEIITLERTTNGSGLGINMAKLIIWNATFNSGTALFDVVEGANTSWYTTNHTFGYSVTNATYGDKKLITGGVAYNGSVNLGQIAVFNYTDGEIYMEAHKEFGDKTEIYRVIVMDSDEDGTDEIWAVGRWDDSHCYVGIWNYTDGVLYEETNMTPQLSAGKSCEFYDIVSGDLYGDGDTEYIVVGEAKDGSNVINSYFLIYNWNGSDYLADWTKNWYDGSLSELFSVAIGDIDYDGTQELIISGNYYNGVRDIETIWLFNVTKASGDGGVLVEEGQKSWYTAGHSSATTVLDSDIDLDDVKEITTVGFQNDGTTDRGDIRIYRWNGTFITEKSLQWNETTAVRDGDFADGAAYADLNNDGVNELVSVGRYAMTPPTQTFLRIYSIGGITQSLGVQRSYDVIPPTFSDFNLSEQINSTSMRDIYFRVNITDAGVGVNSSWVRMWYAINDSINSDIYRIYINGSFLYPFWRNETMALVRGEMYNVTIDDNHYQPGTYNYEIHPMENAGKSNLTVYKDNPAKIKLINVTTIANALYILEFFANITSSLTTYDLNIYLYNSSNSSVGLDSIPSGFVYSHQHGDNSSHIAIAFSSNGSSQISGMGMTETMYIGLFSEQPSVNKAWVLKYITINTSTMETSSDDGATWDYQSGTADLHLHQKSNHTYFLYKVEARDNLYNVINSSLQSLEILEVGIPTNPIILIPEVNSSHKGILNISWTPSLHPLEYDFNYTLYLTNNTNGIIQVIAGNLSKDTINQTFDTSSVGDGDYRINITACDNIATTCGSSFMGGNFTIDNSAPTMAYVIPPTPDNNSRQIGNSVRVNISYVDPHIQRCQINWSGTIYEMTDNDSTNFWITFPTVDGVSYWFNVTCNDTLGNTNTTETYHFTENSVPVSGTPTISVTDYVSSAHCYNTTFTDNESDNASFYYIFWVNGNLAQNSNSSRLDDSYFVQGDRIICGIIPWDGWENGSIVNSSEGQVGSWDPPGTGGGPDFPPVLVNITINRTFIVTPRTIHEVRGDIPAPVSLRRSQEAGRTITNLLNISRDLRIFVLGYFFTSQTGYQLNSKDMITVEPSGIVTFAPLETKTIRIISKIPEDFIGKYSVIISIIGSETEKITVSLDGSVEEEPEWKWDIWSILESLKLTAFVLFGYDIKYFFILIAAVLLWLWWGWRKKKKKQEEIERRKH